jgi:curli biogenesis system outer membrane secretion channel CsgG
MMPKSHSPIIAVVALSVGTLLATTNIASAQQQKAQKLSYEQAYEKCRTEIGAGTDANAGPSRYVRAGACMKKYGYKLKQ